MNNNTIKFIEEKYAKEYERSLKSYDTFKLKPILTLFFAIILFFIIINSITLSGLTLKLILTMISLSLDIVCIWELFSLMKSDILQSRLNFFDKEVLKKNDVFSKPIEYISEQLIDDYDLAIKDVKNKCDELLMIHDFIINILFACLLIFSIVLFM